MQSLLRHSLSILLLPFMVVILVPAGLRRSFGVGAPVFTAGTLGARLMGGAAVVVLAAGLGLFAWCVGLFAQVGQGTLAPWDPTRRLVAVGPYRYVRNPMILGVALMLAGQALWWASWPLAAWAALFVLVNHLYFVLSEEPGLERRFGEAYRAYKAAVPRWLPRLAPAGKSPPLEH
jgi:protein-S-isoprenylcysteine O-methyltransferase Ste14